MWTEKHVLEKMFSNGSATTIVTWNDSQWIGKRLILQKKRFPAEQAVKKILLIVFWDMKGPITIDFLKISAIANSSSL